jgi:hypothetical protein
MTRNLAPLLRRARLALLVATVPGVLVCNSESRAQETDRVTIDARRCMEIEAADERLACFERQVDDAGGERSQPSSRASVETSPPRGEDKSTSAAEAARAPRRDRAGDAAPQDELVANISALEQRARDRYLITLDSGEIYEQRFPERYALRVGQRVRIYRSHWGDTERLQADGVNGFIQVVRVR